VFESRIFVILNARENKYYKSLRNDRLIATALVSERYSRIKEFSKLTTSLQNEIILFFNTYNALEEKDFEIIATGNSNEALKTIK
jgi:inorganic pyrophosphatase